jgi:predicted secreted protein
MSNVLRLCFGLALCCLLCVACAPAQKAQAGAEHNAPLCGEQPAAAGSPAKPSHAAQATAASSITLRLEGNATTGYGWQLINIEPQGIVTCSAASYEPLPHAEGMMGVGGTFIFTLQAHQKGRAKLTFAYRRPWQPEAEAQQRTVMLMIDEQLGIEHKPEQQ